MILVESRIFAPRHFWGTLVKRTILSAAAAFTVAAAAFTVATAAHAGELSDVQAQSKELREQNQALTKRIADLERRQRKPAQRKAARCCSTTSESGGF